MSRPFRIQAQRIAVVVLASGLSLSPVFAWGQDPAPLRDIRPHTERETLPLERGSYQFRSDEIRAADIGLWFDRLSDQGLVIADLAPHGAIAKLGFHEGDHILSVNGQRVLTERQFLDQLFTNEARHDRVKAVVQRRGFETAIWVTPQILIDEYAVVENDPLEHFGIILDDRIADRLVIWRVIPRSPAFYAGLRSGDVITRFRGEPIFTRQDLVQVISDKKLGDVPVQVQRQERLRNYRVDVPAYEPRVERRTVYRPVLDPDRPRRGQEGQLEELRVERWQQQNNVFPSIHVPTTEIAPKK